MTRSTKLSVNPLVLELVLSYRRTHGWFISAGHTNGTVEVFHVCRPHIVEVFCDVSFVGFYRDIFVPWPTRGIIKIYFLVIKIWREESRRAPTRGVWNRGTALQEFSSAVIWMWVQEPSNWGHWVMAKMQVRNICIYTWTILNYFRCYSLW